MSWCMRQIHQGMHTRDMPYAGVYTVRINLSLTCLTHWHWLAVCFFWLVFFHDGLHACVCASNGCVLSAGGCVAGGCPKTTTLVPATTQAAVCPSGTTAATPPPAQSQVGTVAVWHTSLLTTAQSPVRGVALYSCAVCPTRWWCWHWQADACMHTACISGVAQPLAHHSCHLQRCTV